MRRLIAVALLDCRRLGFTLLSAALMAGLVPSLASGLGGTAPAESILVVAFAVTGIAAGGQFGNDFTDGRAAFFFARPLSAATLIAGRIGGALALSAATFAAFMTSYGLSSHKRSDFHLDVLNTGHAKALAIGWALALYFGLAIAAHARLPKGPVGLRGAMASLFRLVGTLGAFIFIFGLFADLTLRAYFATGTPIRLFFGSWVAAAFVASCIAMVAGRTEQLRIARLQNRVMAVFIVLFGIAVAAAWGYVLHPGAARIQTVQWGTVASPDGRTAHVVTSVDRGDSRSFRPVFMLDVASGRAERLDADPYLGPWPSSDGGTIVWSEATPFFFRPLWRFLGGNTSFRVRSPGGDAQALVLPSNVPDAYTAKDLALGFSAVDYILPSPDGKVFAIFWRSHLAFTSRSMGALSEVDLGPGRPRIVGAMFLASGALRAARVHQDQAASILDILDIDPKSGNVKDLFSMEVGPVARVEFDGAGVRGLLTSSLGTRGSMFLIDLNSPTGVPPVPLVRNGVNPSAVFLADGRVAATANTWENGFFRTFSATGKTLLDIHFESGIRGDVRGEMFPGILAVTFTRLGVPEEALVDASTGATVRRIAEGTPLLHSWFLNFRVAPPPGSPAARLILSRDRKLYELPSVTAEPRLLLPLPRR